MPKLSLKPAIAAALASLACTASASGPAPVELVAAIAKVNSAATRRDDMTLRASMNKEFVWSFGGDGDVDQALAEWKKDAR